MTSTDATPHAPGDPRDAVMTRTPRGRWSIVWTVLLLPFPFMPYRWLWLPCALGLTALCLGRGRPWRVQLRRHDTLIVGAPLILVLRIALAPAWWMPWCALAALVLLARARLRWTRRYALPAIVIIWPAALLLLAPAQHFWNRPDLAASKSPLSGTKARPVIVFAGDSLTSGVNPGTDQGTYVAALRAMYASSRAPDLTIINAGRASDRTADLLKRFDREVLAHEPGVIVLFIGGNDYLDGTPRGAFADAYEQVASRAAASGARLVFVEVPTGIVWDPFAGVIRHAAACHGAVLVPESRLRLWFSLELIARDVLDEPLTIDGIHLSPVGADRVAAWLEPYVRMALMGNLRV